VRHNFQSTEKADEVGAFQVFDFAPGSREIGQV